MELQAATKAFVINKEGKVLLLEKNTANRRDYKWKWDIPGGRIQWGIGLLDNLKREVFEETGLTFDRKPKLIFAQDIIREKFHIVRLSYLVQAEGEIVLSDEHLSYEWVPYNDLLIREGLDTCIQEVLENVPREMFHTSLAG